MPAFLDPAEAEFWVGVGLLIFLAIAAWKGRGAITGALDAKANKIRADLAEAERLRNQAQVLLTSIQAEREESERRSQRLLEDAKVEAARIETEARTKLEEQIARRAAAAERRIALAEQQAAQDVKAAAADLAARAAEAVLRRRVAEGQSDPLIDRGIDQVAAKLQ